jgi:hypothetical protein
MSNRRLVPPPSQGITKPKLLDQVREKCRVLHYSLHTEKSYVAWIRQFILFHNKRHPLQMGRAEVEAFLSHLAVERHVAASASKTWTSNAIKSSFVKARGTGSTFLPQRTRERL